MPAGKSDRHKQPLKGAFLTRHLAHLPPCITQQSSPRPTVSSVRRMCRQSRSYTIYPIPLPSPHSSLCGLGENDYIAIWDRERTPVPFTALDVNLRPVAAIDGAFPFGWSLAPNKQDGRPEVDVLDAFREKWSQYSGQTQSITVRDYLCIQWNHQEPRLSLRLLYGANVLWVYRKIVPNISELSLPKSNSSICESVDYVQTHETA